jgi:tRNA threonylcarbamoyladenosine biosynthesis protein TsaE
MREYLAKTENDLLAIAEQIVKNLKGGEIVGLIGDLGAGKTSLVKAIVKVSGSKVRVKSPTFAIANEYEVDFGNIRMFRHMDLYRFENPSELEALTFDRDDSVVTLVEWPNIFEERSFPVGHEIRIEVLEDGTRKILSTL